MFHGNICSETPLISKENQLQVASDMFQVSSNMLQAAPDMLQCANGDSDFIKEAITRNETWVNGYKPKTKAQSTN